MDHRDRENGSDGTAGGGYIEDTYEIDDAITRAVEAYRKKDLETHDHDGLFSDRHNRRMRRIFAKERRIRAYSRLVGKPGLLFQALAAMLVVAVVLLMASPSVRATVLETVISWFDGSASFSGPQTDREEYAEYTAPSYIPDGFTETRTTITGAITETVHTNEAGVEMVFTAVKGYGSSITVDTEGSECRMEAIGPITYTTFESHDGDNNDVIWFAGGYRFHLASLLPVEELLKVAVSVVQTQP
jgi:hypothetical protein